MCMVSMIHDYARERVPMDVWTPASFEQFKQILDKLAALDAKLSQPECEDPAKAAWMREVEARLAALEDKII